MADAKADSGTSKHWARVAFRNGEVAARDGVPRTANPHPPGSVPAENWLNGWRTGNPATRAPRKPAPPPAPGRPVDTQVPVLIEKLPHMADDALNVLGANAERLAVSGSPKQQMAAQAALPAIRAEIATRQEAQAAKAVAKPGRRVKTVAAKTA